MLRRTHLFVASLSSFVVLAACGGGDAGNDNAGNDAATDSGSGGGDTGIPSTDGGGTDTSPSGDSGGHDTSTDAPTIPTGYQCSRPPTRTGAPELPRISIDTTYPKTTGKVTTLKNGDDLQAAIDAASPGDEIDLAAGAQFGAITLPKKSGDGWIVIRTATKDTDLPQGKRVVPADAPKLAKIVASTTGPAIQANDGAHHYRFVGLEVTSAAGVSVYQMIQLDAITADVSAMPHDVMLDRMWIHGDPATGGKRGVQINGGSTAIIDSSITDFKREGQDSQAIGGWEGTGPYRIVNNELEGAAENVLYGGADGRFPGVVASDIEICHNHFYKPTSWKTDAPDYAGTAWSVKNLLELKEGMRVLVADNTFEQVWVMAQVGYAMLFKSTNQSGGAPWNVTQDVTVVNNLIFDAGAGVNLLGKEGTVDVAAHNIWLHNNLFYAIGTKAFDGDERLFQILPEVDNAWFTHNTGGAPNTFIASDGDVHKGFVFQDNVVEHGMYGIHGSGLGDGTSTLDAEFAGYVFDHDVIIGGDAKVYPAGSFYPADDSAVPFTDVTKGDWSLSSASSFKGKASDGTDPGVDMKALLAAIGP
jgi:hypothetical protein